MLQVGKNVLLNHHETFHEPPPGSKTHLNKHGQPSDALQNLSLSVLDAFGSVHDILYQSNLKHQRVSDTINALPMRTPDHKVKAIDHEAAGPFCHDDDLLLLKATSQSALSCMENALAVLQDIREFQQGQHCKKHQDGQQKSGSNNAGNSVKSSKIGGLLTPTAMSPSRKVSIHSTNSAVSMLNVHEDNFVSSSISNRADDVLTRTENFGAKERKRSQFDTMSVTSAGMPPIEGSLSNLGYAEEHGKMSALSRSTPSVNIQQGMKVQPRTPAEQKLITQGQETDAQSS